jgi:hypothetical protein
VKTFAGRGERFKISWLIRCLPAQYNFFEISCQQVNNCSGFTVTLSLSVASFFPSFFQLCFIFPLHAFLSKQS